MPATIINGITPASGTGVCFEQHTGPVYVDVGSGVIRRTVQARTPRPRVFILSNITEAEAVAIAAVAGTGAAVTLQGDFVPAAAASGTSRGFTAQIDGTSGRGTGRLEYETAA